MPAAPRPHVPEVQGRGRPSRLLGAGSMRSTPRPPASRIPRGGGESNRSPTVPPAMVYRTPGRHYYHAPDPCDTVRIRSIDDRTERERLLQLLEVRSDGLDPVAPPEKGASTTGPIR